MTVNQLEHTLDLGSHPSVSFEDAIFIALDAISDRLTLSRREIANMPFGTLLPIIETDLGEQILDVRNTRLIVGLWATETN